MQTDIENQEQEQQAPLFSRLFRPELNLSGQSKKSQIDFGRLDDAQLKGKLQEKNLQGRVGFTGETKEGTSYGFGADLSTSKAKIKTPEELRQFGVPETLEFGSGKLQPRSYDAFMALQNVFGVKGLEARINAGYTPREYEKDLKNIGLNLKYRFNKGGTAMKKQMELFEDGGLKDEGGMVDEVSGNDVPSGSTREEVRDDIPAQLSEGEFVFPADVVRYIGLEKLMMMRQEAKQGLKQMEAMGQMGNSDEATMPDDLPFDETDLDIEDDLEYNTGGVVQAQQGTYVAPTVPTGSQPLGTTPMGAPPIPQQVGTGVSGTAFGTPYTPNVGKMYGAGATPYAPVTYTELLGPSAAGAPQTKNVRYVNEATNQTRMIPHLLNADGTIGDTLYPVPEGFVRKDEAPKEEAKKTQVQTAKVASVDAGDGGDGGAGGGAVDLAGDPLSYSSVFSMDALDKQMAKIGAMQLSTLGKAGVFQGISSAATGNPERNQMKLGALTPLFTSLKTQLGIKGQDLGKLQGKTPEEIAKIRGVVAADIERVTAAVDRLTTNITFSKDKNGNTISTESNKSTKDTIADVNAMAKQYGLKEIDTKTNVNLGSKIGQKIAEINQAIKDQPTYSEDPSDTIESIDSGAGDVYSDETQTTTAAEQAANQQAAQSFIDNNNTSNTNDGGSSTSTDGGDYGVGSEAGMDFNQGGLAGKKKPKTKKMKRGGLASR